MIPKAILALLTLSLGCARDWTTAYGPNPIGDEPQQAARQATASEGREALPEARNDQSMAEAERPKSASSPTPRLDSASARVEEIDERIAEMQAGLEGDLVARQQEVTEALQAQQALLGSLQAQAQGESSISQLEAMNEQLRSARESELWAQRIAAARDQVQAQLGRVNQAQQRLRSFSGSDTSDLAIELRNNLLAEQQALARAQAQRDSLIAAQVSAVQAGSASRAGRVASERDEAIDLQLQMQLQQAEMGRLKQELTRLQAQADQQRQEIAELRALRQQVAQQTDSG